jgi:opacity protein-like surface antigen
MKKRNSWMAALAAAAVLVAAQTAQAGSVADGGYVGIQAGYGTAIVDATVTENETTTNQSQFSFSDGGLGLDGASYGAFMGFGFRMASLYVGAEIDSNWSTIKLDPGSFTIADTCNGDGCTVDPVTNASAELVFSTGVSGRLGFYPSASTLISLNGGLVGSQFDVSWDNQAEEYWDVGTRYGIGIDTTLFDGVALRLAWNYTDYYDASVFAIGSTQETSDSGHDVEIQPSMSVAHVGLMYTF